MQRLNYAAPTTVDEAVRPAGRSLRPGQGAVGRNRPAGPDALGPAEAGTDRRYQEASPASSASARKRGGFVIGAATPGAMIGGACRPEQAAWPGVVEAMDLIGSDADPGPRLAGRQPVQRLAGRRQRAGADRRRRRRGGRRRQRPARSAGGADRHRSRPHLARQGRVHPGDSSLPPRPAHSGDAYLRFIPRTEMDIAVVGCGVNVTLDADGVCTAARVVAGRGGADRAAGGGRRRRPDRAQAGRRHAGEAGRGGAAACKPINDKRGTIEYRTKVAGVLARRVAAIAFERAQGTRE